MIRKFISRVLRLPGKSRGAARAKIIPFAQHGIRRDELSPSALKVTTRLQEAGFDAFVVGGAVRDLLIGHEPKDFDVATNATPEEVHRLFRRSRIIGRRFRIVHVVFGRDEVIEVTTFRGDGSDLETTESGRIVSDNTYGSMAEDARRRDFTANALYYNTADETIHDYHHGVRDVEARKLVMIGPPIERYKEDPVRMLRAVRLAAKLGFSIDEATRKPIGHLAGLLKDVASARLFDEMLKMLHSGASWACLTRLRAEGLHKGLFPLLDAIIDQPGGEDFVKLALAQTDRRLMEGKGISDGFLFAALLWSNVNAEWQRRLDTGEKSIPALLDAMDTVEARLGDRLAIPRRFLATMREIWVLQPRFEIRNGSRPYRLLEQPRFRAGYDFLCLRAEVGEVPKALAEWWEHFQFADGDRRESMMVTDEPSQDPARKKRRRRRKKPAGDTPGVDA
ncbi:MULTISPECIES: polynucleotide adenylyltransferase PcnB [Microvirgula]|uniref:Poly(A) polymerase I n=1 Tax=Microvirgula aerodenitrificans TaxID=57480 RepID=A0A2U3TH13_9NEIS|nr:MULTISPECIES: polynucleotide adenylyltransferase PcnB [Microvirgula]AVY92687.1 polynucleotide adenylyltransferase PcnB [Microvirgula aerodenitrificans]RAS17426.1 poly(A) polymerase [Microvirgula sp. AG722]